MEKPIDPTLAQKISKDLAALKDKEAERRRKIADGRPRSESVRELPKIRLSWDPLPPGEWSIEHVERHYIENKAILEERFSNKFDIQRINEICKLKPDLAYIGREGWAGYTTFEFHKHSNVILECPFEGNAIYVLRKFAWEDLAKNSKGWIRDNRPDDYIKIVHKGDWIGRVKAALRYF